MTTWTTTSKSSTTLTNTDKAGVTRWDDANLAWDALGAYWDSGLAVFTNTSKSSTTFTNTSKSSTTFTNISKS